MEAFFIDLLTRYGYIILFIWCMMEGEMALIMGGIMSHTGQMDLGLAIFIAGLGGFAGDQVYFYIGRYNKNFISKKLRSQRRKFAIAHILLKKNGWPIIFIQRYMYGLRTVIPMSIGLTRYDAKKFAFINLMSAWCWAGITILPAYFLGEHILDILDKAKDHWYIAIPIAATFLGTLLYGFKRIENKILNERKNRRNAI
ncbi:DedA family protein [Campylobacter sp. RM16192]|uniref:DedA family protein n=1 Tax=Campylobacter sp. RM16192 TaxID=1660080 RepID=UPI0014516BDD|nr:DedA family protein [Campylobacter sp. RM16192]QCD52940.1 putative membrane protein, DedA family, type I (SNARE domain) [Campylobacter sp. RM16192]